MTKDVRSKLIFVLAFLLVVPLISSLGISGNEESPACVTPTNNMAISSNTNLCAGSYNLPDGVRITSSNVVLTCEGTILNGVGGSGDFGINIVNPSSDVTIQNCNIQNYFVGIELNYNQTIPTMSNRIKIIGNNLNSNSFAIDLNFISHSEISSNTVINSISGIALFGNQSLARNTSIQSTNNSITNNQISLISPNFLGTGIWLYKTSLSRTTGNTVANAYIGINVYLFGGQIIQNNNVLLSTTGIQIAGASINDIRYNNLTDNEKGMTIYAAVEPVIGTVAVEDTYIGQNSFLRNTETGLDLGSQTGDNDVIGNTFLENNEGVYIFPLDENTRLQGNYFTSNNLGLNIQNVFLTQYIWNNIFASNDMDAYCSSYCPLDVYDFTGYKGNKWSDIHSRDICDTDDDGYGDEGSQYPYSQANGATKVSGGVEDRGPITSRRVCGISSGGGAGNPKPDLYPSY